MTGEETTILKTDILGRVTMPKEKREELIDAFEQSGLSGVQFAKQHGRVVPTFASWIQKRRRARGDYENEQVRKKLRRGPLGNASTKKTESRKGLALGQQAPAALMNSIEVDMSRADSPSSSLEVVLPSGAKVLVNHESQMPLLKTLMRELSC